MDGIVAGTFATAWRGIGDIPDDAGPQPRHAPATSQSTKGQADEPSGVIGEVQRDVQGVPVQPRARERQPDTRRCRSMARSGLNGIISAVAATTKRAKKTPRPRLRVRMTLRGSRPKVWRLVDVDGSVTLDVFSGIVQQVFEWDGGHLHTFTDTDPRARTSFRGVRERTWADHTNPYGLIEGDELDEAREVLGDVLTGVGDKLFYIYDFGDDWEHVIECEGINPPDPHAPVAVVVRGRGMSPLEDSGGVWGWAEMVEAFNDPNHPEHDEWAGWIGEFYVETTEDGKINPALFTKEDIDGINAGLELL
jgi:hypothetical protein